MLIVSTTGTVVDEAKFTRVGLKLQLLIGGRFEHIDDISVAVPVNPVCAVKVSVVAPDCPGLEMVIVVGLALMENVPPTSIVAADDIDPT